MLWILFTLVFCSVKFKDVVQSPESAHNYIGVTMIQREKLGKKQDAHKNGDDREQV